MGPFLGGPPHSKCLENAKNAAGLENLKGLKGKRIAQNMGTKIGLIQHIYYVIFCAGCGEGMAKTSPNRNFQAVMFVITQDQRIQEFCF